MIRHARDSSACGSVGPRRRALSSGSWLATSSAGEQPGEHRQAAQPRGRDRVHVAVAHLRHRAPAERRSAAPTGSPGRSTAAATSRQRRYSRTRAAPTRRTPVCRRRAWTPRRRCPAVGRAVGVADGASDQRGDLLHVGLVHALGGRRRGADPDARGDARRLRVVRDRVLVQHDAGRVAARLGLGARDAEALQVEQGQVGVGAAGDRAHALGRQAVGERLGVGDDLAGVGLVLRGRGLPAARPPWPRPRA